jgi:hypothetical protein
MFQNKSSWVKLLINFNYKIYQKSLIAGLLSVVIKIAGNLGRTINTWFYEVLNQCFFHKNTGSDQKNWQNTI